MITLRKYITEGILDMVDMDGEELGKMAQRTPEEIAKMFNSNNGKAVGGKLYLHSLFPGSNSAQDKLDNDILSGRLTDYVYSIEDLYICYFSSGIKISSVSEYPIHIEKVNAIVVDTDSFDIDNSKITFGSIRVLNIKVAKKEADPFKDMKKMLKNTKFEIVNITHPPRLNTQIDKFTGFNCDRMNISIGLIPDELYERRTFNMFKPTPAMVDWYEDMLNNNKVREIRIVNDIAGANGRAYLVEKTKKGTIKLVKL